MMYILIEWIRSILQFPYVLLCPTDWLDIAKLNKTAPHLYADRKFLHTLADHKPTIYEVLARDRSNRLID